MSKPRRRSCRRFTGRCPTIHTLRYRRIIDGRPPHSRRYETATPGRTLDVDGNEVEVITKGRHDPCVGIRATPIAEAMVALVLMDHVLRQRAQNPER